VGLRPLACWDSEFESRRGQVFVSCECCVLSEGVLCDGLIPTECDVSERDGEASIMRRPLPTRGCCAMGDNI
jgi:hypothetical protein